MTNLTNPSPAGQFQLVVADPPWRYNDKKLNRGGAERHYNTLSIEEIRRINVSEVAAKDAILMMWATGPLLPEALTVLKSWGFNYVTVGFVWVKRSGNWWENLARAIRGDLRDYEYLHQDAEVKAFSLQALSRWFGGEWIRRLAANKFFFGMGYYTRANAEFVLLGGRGKAAPLIKDHGVQQVIDEAVQAHSVKPDEFFKRLDLLVGDVPRLEMFSRNRRPGWKILGDQLDADYCLDEQFRIVPDPGRDAVVPDSGRNVITSACQDSGPGVFYSDVT